MKYEITENFIKMSQLKLYQIRALRDIGDDIKAGDLGGYIQSEKNLSQDGECWVYEDGRVFDNAEILGNAKVKSGYIYDYAKIHDNVKVSNSSIYGNARLYHNAKVKYGNISGYAILAGNTTINTHCYLKGNIELKDNVEINCFITLSEDITIEGNVKIDDEKDIFIVRNVGTENGTLVVAKGRNNKLIAIRGCFTGTVKQFLRKSAKVHDDNTHLEYKLLLKVAKRRILGCK